MGARLWVLIVLALATGCAPGARREPGPEGPPLSVQGRLAADATWRGTVILADDFQVPRGRTLRILPGTRVLVRPADTTKTEPEFLDNATELLVRGTILAGGEKAGPVIFEPLPGAPGDEGAARWGGIIFDGGGGELRNARVSGADTGVTLLDASPALSGLTIADVRLGIAVHDGSAPRISEVMIMAQESAVACLPGSRPELEGVEGLSREHEGLLVAPGAAPLIRRSWFQGGYADLLWGAATEPPAEFAQARLLRVATAAPEAQALPPLPFEPRVSPPAAPSRVYRGEQFVGEDTTWEGEVLIDGTVMVSPAARLTVAPGTVVRFAFRDGDGDGVGESEIFVQGRLVAEGAAQAPIVFTALDGDGPGRWGAINLMGSDAEESRLSWCLVEKSFRGLHSHFSRLRAEHSVFRDNYRSIQFQESAAAIVDCAVTGSASALRFRDSTAALEGLLVAGNTLGVQILRSSFSLTGSTIAGNALAGVHVRESEGTVSGSRLERNTPGLRLSDCRAVIEGNRLVANRVAGLQLRRTAGRIEGNRIAGNLGNGVSTDGPGAVLRGNAIAGNLRFALESSAAEAIDATGNWWGPGGPTGEAIWDAEDDRSLGPVLTEPRLAAPPR